MRLSSCGHSLRLAVQRGHRTWSAVDGNFPLGSVKREHNNVRTPSDSPPEPCSMKFTEWSSLNEPLLPASDSAFKSHDDQYTQWVYYKNTITRWIIAIMTIVIEYGSHFSSVWIVQSKWQIQSNDLYVKTIVISYNEELGRTLECSKLFWSATS